MKHWLLTLLLCLVAAVEARGADRPNILFIVTDDQGAWSVGAYGNKDSQTLNQDRLAKEGAMFTRAMAATPVCSPSRASFLTGRWGTQLNIVDWIHPIEADRLGLGLPDVPTWPGILQAHGYKTALVGKWHLGTKPAFHPTRHGFDHFYGFLDGGTRPMNASLDFPDGKKVVPGCLADHLTDDAIAFMKENKDHPFSLSLHFREPHLPYGPVPAEDSEPYRNIDPEIPSVKGISETQIKELRRRYYASIHEVDRNLGRVLQALDELKLSDKTTVLFTSDHGYNIGQHVLHTKGNAWWIAGGIQGPKRCNMFDTSLQVPFMVRWPGHIKPGTVVTRLVSNIDTFKTICSLAGLGAAVPPEIDQSTRDFSPLLLDPAHAEWTDEIYGQYDVHNGALAYMRMVRTDRYKMIRHLFCNGMDELYDLQADPGEETNLYNRPEHRKLQAQLEKKLDTWMNQIHDPTVNDPRRVVEFDGTPAAD